MRSVQNQGYSWNEAEFPFSTKSPFLRYAPFLLPVRGLLEAATFILNLFYFISLFPFLFFSFNPTIPSRYGFKVSQLFFDNNGFCIKFARKFTYHTRKKPNCISKISYFLSTKVADNKFPFWSLCSNFLFQFRSLFTYLPFTYFQFSYLIIFSLIIHPPAILFRHQFLLISCLTVSQHVSGIYVWKFICLAPNATISMKDLIKDIYFQTVDLTFVGLYQ